MQRVLLLTLAVAATSLAACAKDPVYGTGAAGTGGGGGSGGGGGQVAGVCSDPQAWTPPAAPGLCTDTAPAAPGGAAAVTLAVDAGTVVRPWNRFYENAVALDHANTLLCTAYGRNSQNALRKAHAQAGFKTVRFHGIFNDDVAVYSEDASGAAIYDWSRLDAIYDAVVAAGMHPFVEVSFTPSALASTSQVQNLLWYNNRSPNVSAPIDAPDGNWSKWIAFMAAFVGHIEERYTAAEVRDNWYFEVWNEPSWMYGPALNGYFELYENTVAGLLQGDPGLRVGGPAGSAGESPGSIRTLITGSLNKGIKLDFVSYHRYGDDNGLPIAGVKDSVAFHANIVNVVDTTIAKSTKFMGEILNNEFGPSYMPDVSRDNEVAATYITKMIHLLGSDPVVRAPSAYGYWALSDLYEEINTGATTAFRQGNYGLLLKGDPQIPESFDVAKPSFNAFRLLHMMGDQQLGVTGGTTGDGVGAVATRSADGSAVQVIVYNHVDGGQGDSSQSAAVSLTLNNLPFTGPIRVRQYIVDRNHANAYRAWLAVGAPPRPNQSQWVMLRDAAELCYYESSAQAPAGAVWTLAFPQSVYGVTLFEITPG